MADAFFAIFGMKRAESGHIPDLSEDSIESKPIGKRLRRRKPQKRVRLRAKKLCQE